MRAVRSCLLQSLLLLAALVVGWPVPGGPTLPGGEALRYFRGWQAARRLQALNLRNDLESLLPAAEEAFHLDHNPEPLALAVYRRGVSRTAPSQGLPSALAAELAASTAHWLDRHLAELPDPRDALRLEVFLIAGRVLPLQAALHHGEPSPALRQMARHRYLQLLAAGGGGRPDPDPYLQFLAQTPAARPVWLDRELQKMAGIAGLGPPPF